jgi:hypothetical protein
LAGANKTAAAGVHVCPGRGRKTTDVGGLLYSAAAAEACGCEGDSTDAGDAG